MLGSKLDIAIRKEGQKEFQKTISIKSHSFETADIGFTFFVINGCLRQVPYFFTNDPTNVHIVRNNIVRCYTYDSDDRGRELSYYVTDNKLCVIRNDGTESLEDVSVFFDFCPYSIDQEVYMSFVYKKNNTFDIDHLANKIIVSPGYHVDLNPFFKHNAFPKNILAFNALKNAILATDPAYSLYFMDTISSYMKPTKQHHVVLPPVDDDFSIYFALKIPKVTVAYMSFMGNNQEDCIVMNNSLKVFNCYRFYTIRVKFNVSDRLVFYPVSGDNETDCLGTIVYHGEETIQVEPLSVHVKIMSVKNNIFNLHFTKYPFKILQYNLTKDRLSICVDQFHETNTGDKLCSLHGQKGVVRKMDKMPIFDEQTIPEIIINPYSLFRMTMGQIKEGIERGNGKDAKIVRNSDGKIIPGGKAFYAGTLYFAVSYFSNEHFYAPTEYVRDKINDQPVERKITGWVSE
ncbi:RNA_pol_Rpb2_6 domain-containing protein [Trichonephila inaurata madagascariensis]|uniref:DNA-directed RNA polymerase n=1 Tax=Trichonephila inaurata madagascariensis TaxID=2747483 RepID=A0A8X6Y7D7_9ARAC|nr:RNA_pol_Rpb2_6 domain-containing protein [Trichonephila inaurata madagascariensis]